MARADTVLAVDDGSTDDTLEEIRRTGCLWIRSEKNEGKGLALKRAFEAILQAGSGPVKGTYEYIVTLDGDGQHRPEEIPNLLRRAEEGHSDIVVGVRRVEKMPLKSKIGGAFSRALFQATLSTSIPDTQSGFRVVRTEALRTIFDKVAWGRYETEMDMLCRGLSEGLSIDTAPIQTIYFEKNRLTHFRPLIDSMKVLMVLFRYTLVSLAVTAVDLSAYGAIIAFDPDSYVSANIWSRIASVVCHFLLARHFAFLVHGGYSVAEVVRYLMVVLVNLSVTMWMIWVLVDQFGMPAFLAKVASQTVAFFGTFVLLKVFVYRVRET